MTGKKKHRTRNLILAVIVLAVFIGIYLAVVNFAKREEEKEQAASQADTVQIVSMDSDHVDHISYLHDGQTLSFHKKSEDDTENWYYDGDESIPINKNTLDSMVSGMTSLEGTSTVAEDDQNYEEYGLDQPSNQITLQDTDGTKITVLIGDTNSITGEYYAAVQGEAGVYTVASTAVSGFESDLMSLVEADSYPAISMDTISNLTLAGADESVSIQKAGDTDAYNWKLIRADGSEAGIRTEYAEELLQNVTEASYTGLKEYNSKDLSVYGLSEPALTLTVDYTIETNEEGDGGDTETVTTPQQFVLMIGSQDEDGGYYAKPADNSNVYLISADRVLPLLEAGQKAEENILQ
ncbi:DUF4340 domain-containing protein [Diplocloster agilis]|uniref:DUF4340 domain-containing protein n=1 Tax=Diplocloster agilis TaxID=2850323 RepID=UPI0008227E88|nr:DUF4340 domain-containing protein [Suonthocola fibrivorans]MCU6736880.1 DUF4340 domain-containing protein [Suonthocola fibrivorans]SCJ94211.1 Uncharacterised protein [uncultured Clostridium sp.]